MNKFSTFVDLDDSPMRKLLIFLICQECLAPNILYYWMERKITICEDCSEKVFETMDLLDEEYRVVRLYFYDEIDETTIDPDDLYDTEYPVSMAMLDHETIHVIGQFDLIDFRDEDSIVCGKCPNSAYYFLERNRYHLCKSCGDELISNLDRVPYPIYLNFKISDAESLSQFNAD